MKLILLGVYFILLVTDASRVCCQSVPDSIGTDPSSPSNVFATGYYGFIVNAFFLKNNSESYFWRYGEGDSFRDTNQFYVNGSGCTDKLTSSGETIICGEITITGDQYISSDLTYLQPLANDLVISVRRGTPNDVSSPVVLSLPRKTVQDCPQTLEDDNVILQFNSTEYNDVGTFTCANNGLLYYSNGDQPISNQTTCLYTAEWSGQDNLQCWTAPNVMINATKGNFTVIEGNNLTVVCEYKDVIPNGVNTAFYSDGNEIRRQQDRSFTFFNLSRTDNKKQVSCQAVTPYTEIFKESGKSTSYNFNVQYISSSVAIKLDENNAPYLIKTGSEYLLRSDQSISMNCSSQGNPTPQCYFTICDGVCTTISNTDNDCFTRQFLTDDGSLSCAAFNKVGSYESANTTITVIPASRKVTLSYGDVIIENKTMTLPIEDALILTCNSDYANKLNTSFTWTGPNMTTLSRQVLNISSLNPFDTGNYTCNTEDAFGSFNNTINVDVIYAPFQDHATSCNWILNKRGSCNVIFMSNPHSEFLALIKNNSGQNVEGGKLMDNDDPFFQTFQFMKDYVTESDKGTYILHLNCSVSPYNYTIAFNVTVNEKSPRKPVDNVLAIVLPVVFGVLLIIASGVCFIWYKKSLCFKKKITKGSSSALNNSGGNEESAEDNSEREERVNPLYASSSQAATAEAAYTMVDKKKKKKGAAQKETKINPLYVSADQPDGVELAYGVGKESKKKGTTEKEEKVNPLYVTSEQTQAVNSPYAEVDKKKKRNKAPADPNKEVNQNTAYAEVNKPKKKKKPSPQPRLGDAKDPGRIDEVVLHGTPHQDSQAGPSFTDNI